MPSDEYTRMAEVLDTYIREVSTLQGKTGTASHAQRPGDVHIMTYPKSGTNYLRQIVYQIIVAAGGAPSFDPDGEQFEDIEDVVPALEFRDIMKNARPEATTTPRVFASHLDPTKIDTTPHVGGKFIYCFRNVEKVPSSLLDFSVEWIIPGLLKTDKDREAFFHYFVKAATLGLGAPKEGGEFEYEEGDMVHGMSKAVIKEDNKFELGEQSMSDWFEHVKAWTDIRNQDNVFVVAYERVCKDPRGTAARIAEFLEMDLTEDGLDTVVHRCSREYMLRHSHKFQVPILGMKGEPGYYVRPAGDVGFHAFKFDAFEKKVVRSMFRVGFGVENYDELVERVAS